MTDLHAQKADQPFDRLTRLCDVATHALDDAVEIEAEEARGQEGVNLTPVKAIVFLEDDESAGIVIHGYDDSMDAMTALFLHMKAIFQANGKDLDFVGIPDSPEGIDT